MKFTLPTECLGYILQVNKSHSSRHSGLEVQTKPQLVSTGVEVLAVHKGGQSQLHSCVKRKKKFPLFKCETWYIFMDNNNFRKKLH